MITIASGVRVLSYEEISRLADLIRSYLKQYGYDIDKAPYTANRILCIAPHPDDCEVGAGGLLAKASDHGTETYMLVLTDGSMGTSRPGISRDELALRRRREQEEAAKVLGVKKVYWLGYRDGFLPYTDEARLRIATIIRRVKPDLVLAPDPWMMYEAHPDHRRAGLLVSEAFLYSGFPLYGPETGDPWSPRYIAYYYTGRPNVYVDITGYLEKKLEALKKHESQLEGLEPLLKLLVVYAEQAGKKIGVKYAEPLKILPRILVHAIPLAEII